MASIILLLIVQSYASLSFDQALSKIAEQDPTLKGQMAKVQSQEVSALSGTLRFLPTLSATYGRDHSANTETTVYGSNLILNANLFKAGGDFFNARSTYHLLKSEEANLQQSEITAQKGALTLLVNYILAEKKHSIVSELLVIQKNSASIAKKRYDRGLIPMQDMEKAEVDVFNSEARLMNAQIERENFQKQVQSYLGNEKLKLDWPYTDVLLSGKKSPQLEESEKRRDVVALEKYVDSMDSYHSSRFSAFVPQIDLSYKLTNSSYESGFLSDRGAEDKILSVNLTWTLFNGYRDRAQLAQALYLLEESRNRLTDLARESKASREAKTINFKSALESLSRRLKTLEISRKIYRQSVRKFQDGKLSFNDLEIDQNRYLETELLAQEGQAQVHLALSDLCLEYARPMNSCL